MDPVARTSFCPAFFACLTRTLSDRPHSAPDFTMTASSRHSTLTDARPPDSAQPAIGRSPATARRRMTFRSAVRAISLFSLLASLPWVDRLLAAGLGAMLAVLGAIVALQLLALLAFYFVGLLPMPEGTELSDSYRP